MHSGGSPESPSANTRHTYRETMIVRAAVVALAGLAGLYVLAWHVAVSLDEADRTS